MKLFLRSALLLVVAAAGIAAQTEPAEEQRLGELRAKRARGEQPTTEEQEFVKRVMARRNAEFARGNPARESTGLVPLTDLGMGAYRSEAGGLYPDRANTPPQAHLRAGAGVARRIAAVEGKIALLSLGMSNTTQEFQAFQKLAGADAGLNPRLMIVDGAQGGQAAEITADPKARFWSVVEERVAAAAVTPGQVQAVWLKQAIIQPTQPFPAEARRLESYLIATLHNAMERFPNLKIAYLSSRIYGGYASTPLNPEPHAYESAFAVKWVIARQLAGAPELNWDPARGAVRSPWLAWGPYLWADGVQGRRDGLLWQREDLAADGTHPSLPGREKVGRLLLEFLKKDPSSRPWFVQGTER